MSGSQIVIITGVFGKKPELSFTPSGTAVCKFSLATSERIKDQDVTSWHKCTAFGKTGEIIEKYHDKGSWINIEGRLQYGKYNKNGVDVYTTDIIVNKFSFVGSKGQSNQGQNNQSQGQQNQQQNQYDASSDLPF